MKKIVLFLILNAAAFSASAGLNDLLAQFEAAKAPSVESGTSWWSGRCYAVRSPEQEISGFMILYRNPELVKVHVPAYSLDVPSDLWDELDQEEITRIEQFNFISTNKGAKFENGSLVSTLEYEPGYGPIGILSLRQSGNDYFLKMTNLGEADGGDLKIKFACKLNKRVK